MTQISQPPTTKMSAMEQVHSWLATLWLLYVLTAFIIIRILGSGMAHRFIAMAKAKLGR